MTYFSKRLRSPVMGAIRALLPFFVFTGALVSQPSGASGTSVASGALASVQNSGPGNIKPGAVIYGVVPPLFGKNPLRDSIANLDKLQRSGADILWISPLNTTDDPGAISYSVTDYFGLRSDFGTSEDFKEFVRGAHARGMKVIIDFVPNHTSHAHPYFKEAQEKGNASSYYKYYERNENGDPTNYFDWKHLPNLNFNHLPVLKMIGNAFKHWIREYDVDGFRIDVAWGIRERAPDFWPKLNRELRAIKPGIVLLAEAGARDPYYFENEFDLAYDWTDQLGVWAWKGFFEEPDKIAPKLHQALTSAQSTPFQVARFLNNNDTGKRFITRYGAKLTKVAAVMQHTLPGTPIVYMGDETGAEFEPYEDPPPLTNDDRHGLSHHYRKLARLRERLPALYGTEWASLQPRQSNGESGVYGYFRSNAGKSPVLVLLNFGRASSVEFEIPAAYRKYFSSTGSRREQRVQAFRDVLTGKAYELSIHERRGLIRATLQGESAILLRVD